MRGCCHLCGHFVYDHHPRRGVKGWSIVCAACGTRCPSLTYPTLDEADFARFLDEHPELSK